MSLGRSKSLALAILTINEFVASPGSTFSFISALFSNASFTSLLLAYRAFYHFSSLAYYASFLVYAFSCGGAREKRVSVSLPLRECFHVCQINNLLRVISRCSFSFPFVP